MSMLMSVYLEPMRMLFAESGFRYTEIFFPILTTLLLFGMISQQKNSKKKVANRTTIRNNELIIRNHK